MEPSKKSTVKAQSGLLLRAYHSNLLEQLKYQPPVRNARKQKQNKPLTQWFHMHERIAELKTSHYASIAEHSAAVLASPAATHF